MNKLKTLALLSAVTFSTVSFANPRKAASAAARIAAAAAAQRARSAQPKTASPVFEFDPRTAQAVPTTRQPRTVIGPLCSPTTCSPTTAENSQPPRNVDKWKRQGRFAAFQARVWVAQDFTFYDDNGVAMVMDWAKNNHAQTVE